jgi:hypothetical protein
VTGADLDSQPRPLQPESPDEQTKQRHRKPRRPHLSEEFVRDDDSDFNDDGDGAKVVDDRGPNLSGKPRLVVTLKIRLPPRYAEPEPERQKQQRRPRNRKSYLSQEFVGDDSSDLDDEEGNSDLLKDAATPLTQNGRRGEQEMDVEMGSYEKTPKQRRRSRKSHLSEEFVRDDDTESDAVVDADGDVQMTNGDDNEYTAQTVTPKRRPNKTLTNGDAHSDEEPSSTKKSVTASGRKKPGRKPKNSTIGATATTPRSKDVVTAENITLTNSPTTPSRRGRKKRVSMALADDDDA